MIKKITLIGAGNVATHIGVALMNAGKEILQVYSRTSKSASELADKLKCPYTTDLENILPGSDLYIISVADSAISKTVNEFPLDDVLVAHTSGSTDLDVLLKNNLRPAVFYPLQTFSKNVEVNFDQIPLFLETFYEEDMKKLKAFAGEISSKVYSINSQQRLILHISAVFACNFTNHMFYIAEDILNQHQLDFNILKPLIRETVRKAELSGPYKAQTGPAVRNDKSTLKLHSEILSSFGDYQKFYNFISDSIISKHNQKHKYKK